MCGVSAVFMVFEWHQWLLKTQFSGNNNKYTYKSLMVCWYSSTDISTRTTIQDLKPIFGNLVKHFIHFSKYNSYSMHTFNFRLGEKCYLLDQVLYTYVQYLSANSGECALFCAMMTDTYRRLHALLKASVRPFNSWSIEQRIFTVFKHAV